MEFIGRGQIRAIQKVLKKHAPKKIFLVTGKHSYQACGANSDIDRLLSDYTFVRFHDFSPNPTFKEALQGTKLFEKEPCDFIIAIGGGSAIDMAKTINVFQAHKGKEKELATGQLKLTNTLLPMCIVPTTTGTGSEATHFAVIYVDGDKYSLAHETLLPNYVILDPNYTDTMSPYITACTGFDALSQAIESYWAKGATDESRGYAVQAIPLISNNIELAVNEADRTARENMQLGANYAGKAINISKTTAPHALSYGITRITSLPHGHAVALTLGNFFIINDRCINEGHQALDMFQNLYSLLNVSNANEAKSWWYDLMAKCKLNTDLKEYSLDKERLIDAIISYPNLERLGNHPFQLDKNDLKSALTLC